MERSCFNRRSCCFCFSNSTLIIDLSHGSACMLSKSEETSWQWTHSNPPSICFNQCRPTPTSEDGDLDAGVHKDLVSKPGQKPRVYKLILNDSYHGACRLNLTNSKKLRGNVTMLKFKSLATGSFALVRHSIFRKSCWQLRPSYHWIKEWVWLVHCPAGRAGGAGGTLDVSWRHDWKGLRKKEMEN